MNQTLRPSYPDLHFGDVGGVDFQIGGEIMELDRHFHFDFGNRAARNYKPQAYGEHQRNQLEPEIVNENPLEKAALHKAGHGQSSLPASCRRESCELGGSSSIKLSSIGLGSDGAGA